MLVDSKKQMLSEEAIIVKAVQQTKSEHPVATAFAAIVAEMNEYGCSVLREGNSLFILHHAKDRIGMFRGLNADTAVNYLANSNLFCQIAYKMGFDYLQTQFDDPTLLGLFKAISRKPPNPDMGYTAQRAKDGGFVVTLKLGPERGEGQK